MEKKTKTLTKWLYWFSFAVAVIIAYKTVTSIGQIATGINDFFKNIAPFGAGILIAYILYIPCRKVETTFRNTKRPKFISKKARPLSILTVYIIVLVLIIILLNCIIPPVIQSIIDLVNNFPKYYTSLTEKINELPEDSVWRTEVVSNIMDLAKNIDLKKVINVDQLSQYAQGAINFANGIFDIFVTIVVSIYVLNSRREILNFLKRLTGALFSKKIYRNLGKYFNSTNEIFFHFLSSQCLDAIVVGIITSIAMSIMGVKYSILLGFLIGLFNLIPYVGAIVAVVVATIITILTGGIKQAIIMFIVVVILQQIDANIINPKIVGNSLKMNPLLVILAVTIGGAYSGVVGMFLAVPIIAVLKLLIEDFIKYRSDRPLFDDSTKEKIEEYEIKQEKE